MLESDLGFLTEQVRERRSMRLLTWTRTIRLAAPNRWTRAKLQKSVHPGAGAQAEVNDVVLAQARSRRLRASDVDDVRPARIGQSSGQS